MEYTGKDDEPSLRWRRNERADFDFCANSPPSDGFFYASHSKIEIKHSAEGTEHKIYAKNVPKETSTSDQLSNSELLKSFASGNYSTFSEVQTGSSGQNSGKVLKMGAMELEHWAKSNIRGQADDTAPTPIDHLPQFVGVLPTVRVTNTGSSSLVEKLQNAHSNQDVTPCSTPNITPACSPRGARRTNPFFTGLQESKTNEGGWLFKSPEDGGYQQYEAKVGIQPSTGTQSNNKNIRYVPKPSQLRELNFFSPSSS